VSADLRNAIDVQCGRVKDMGRWVGRATALAGHFALADGAHTRDSVGEARRVRAVPAPRPPELGGHLVRKRGAMSVCVECRSSSAAHASFAAKRCKGSAVLAWAGRAWRAAGVELTDDGGHSRKLTGGVLWCDACGAYGEFRAKGLGDPCRKRPRNATADWRRQRLRSGKHPATGDALYGPTLAEPRSFAVDEGAASNWGVSACAAGAHAANCAASGAPLAASARGAAILGRELAREAATRAAAAVAAG
jgi:hypothetical protein